jgi:hypothetical protein
MQRDFWFSFDKGGEEHIRQFIVSSSRFHQAADDLRALVKVWMKEFGAQERKRISQLGVARAADPCHPRQWFSKHLNTWTFDPGNLVYALAWRCIFRQEEWIRYDYEKWGDIAESFLAMGFGVVYLPPKSHLFPMPIHTAAVLLEKLVQDLYAVVCYFPLVSSFQSLSRLVEIIDQRPSSVARIIEHSALPFSQTGHFLDIPAKTMPRGFRTGYNIGPACATAEIPVPRRLEPVCSLRAPSSTNLRQSSSLHGDGVAAIPNNERLLAYGNHDVPILQPSATTPGGYETGYVPSARENQVIQVPRCRYGNFAVSLRISMEKQVDDVSRPRRGYKLGDPAPIDNCSR